MLELLVAISIIAILAGLLLTTLTRAKAKGQGVACVNNLRQLMLAWKMYIDDNNSVDGVSWNQAGDDLSAVPPVDAEVCIGGYDNSIDTFFA